MTGAVTRRDVLRVGGVAVTVAVTGSACSFLSTKPSGSDSGAGSGKKTKEPPALAARVKAGKLPPVKDRLPSKPLVVKPNEDIGRYGGDWHLRIKGDAYGDAATIYSFAGYENLVRWDPTFKKIIPDIATSYKVNADSTEYVFVLREGMRWSDGKPFGPDDVVFAVQDILMDKRITSVPPFGDMNAAKVDDHTVKVTFTKPNGTFVNYLATRRGAALTDYPRHYLEKFHPKYNPQHATEAKKIGFKDGITVLQDVGGTWSFGRNPHKPTLYAWVLTTSSDQKSQVVVERNPYYWKVDPQGSQLPYIDRIVYQVVGDDEAALLKTLNGEIDVSTPDLKDKPVVAKYRDRGHFRLFDVVPEAMNVACIYPNLTHDDPVKREIFNNRNFRVGLSHAINRDQIIKAVFQRQGEPWQVAPRKESTYLDKEMAKQYTEYDVALANQILDKEYPKKDGRGVRLGPDGKPISFLVDVASIVPTWADVLALVVNFWQKVGIDAHVNTGSPEIVVKRGQANKHDFSVWAGEGGLDGVVLLNPYNYLPLLNPYSFFGVKWADWYNTNGKTGERPPADVQRQMTLYRQVNATSDMEKQARLMKEILQIAKQRFHAIGIAALPNGYGTVANKIGNWPKFTTEGAWVYMSPAPTNPCQYYIKPS
ncbi:ABC transporter substrate-binding protein [Actinopolymorpha rutila]|uniref:Peptide/nickel transport system substrate-binding protein n=1 Tax=Actinopolymorpha rutila TaxID=446787 RepID=A0A852ZFW2_9ACTN|nr:ABC transporter substrate-binding protein [Actinopolymorpha rutila]NYH88529.1 peptide/nickel transport system substrate-binding protein [Actinopolymorpha rutila]